MLSYSHCAMNCTLLHTELVFSDRAPNMYFALVHNRVLMVSQPYKMFDSWKLLV